MENREIGERRKTESQLQLDLIIDHDSLSIFHPKPGLLFSLITVFFFRIVSLPVLGTLERHAKSERHKLSQEKSELFLTTVKGKSVPITETLSKVY